MDLETINMTLPQAVFYSSALLSAAGVISALAYCSLKKQESSDRYRAEIEKEERQTMLAEEEINKVRAERIKVALADPNYQAYLDRRKTIADQYMESSGCYEYDEDIKDHIDAIVGNLEI